MMTLLGIFWPVLVLLPIAFYSRYTHKEPTRQKIEEQRVRTELLGRQLNKEVVPKHSTKQVECIVDVPVDTVPLPDVEQDNNHKMNIALNPKDTTWFIDTKHTLPKPSAAEYKILAALEQYNIHWEREVSFKGLQFTTYSHPRFDFYLPRYRVVIEYDGSAYHESTESKKTDRSKEKFCKENGITVIRYNKKHFYHLQKHIDDLMEQLRVRRKL